ATPMTSPSLSGFRDPSRWRREVSPAGGGGVNIVSPVIDRGCRFAELFGTPSLRTADRKSAGASGVLEAPVIIGGPSRTRTLDPLIKSRSSKRLRKHSKDSPP